MFQGFLYEGFEWLYYVVLVQVQDFVLVQVVCYCFEVDDCQDQCDDFGVVYELFYQLFWWFLSMVLVVVFSFRFYFMFCGLCNLIWQMQWLYFFFSLVLWMFELGCLVMVFLFSFLKDLMVLVLCSFSVLFGLRLWVWVRLVVRVMVVVVNRVVSFFMGIFLWELIVLFLMVCRLIGCF